MPEDRASGIVDASDLTEADWAAIFKLRGAYDKRGAIRLRGGQWVNRYERLVFFWSLIALQCWMIFVFLGVLFFVPFKTAIR